MPSHKHLAVVALDYPAANPAPTPDRGVCLRAALRVYVPQTLCYLSGALGETCSRLLPISTSLPALPGFVFGPQDGGAWGLMNSGIMVLRPDSGDFARVKGLMALRSLRSLDASDQSVWHALYRTFYELPAAYNVHGSSRWATSTSMSSNDSLSARTTSLDGFRDAFIVHAHRGRASGPSALCVTRVREGGAGRRKHCCRASVLLSVRELCLVDDRVVFA